LFVCLFNRGDSGGEVALLKNLDTRFSSICFQASASVLSCLFVCLIGGTVVVR